MKKDIPDNDLGWWYDVCPGKTIKNVRPATRIDLLRCFGTKDKDAKNYVCENKEDGSLINLKAIDFFILRDAHDIAMALENYVNKGNLNGS